VSRGINRSVVCRRSTFVAAVVTVAAILAAAPVRAATTIIVNSDADDTAPDHCTLREAINVADGHGSTGNCAKGTGLFTINFAASLKGSTITLAEQLPAITEPTFLTIVGPDPSSAAGITISGNHRVTTLFVDLGAALSLKYLTVANGDGSDSAGIYNVGALSIANCAVSGNQAISGSGASGGAILNQGFSGLGQGLLTIVNTTFSANSARGYGVTFGGAIANFGGTVNITNSTFSGNEAISDSRRSVGPSFGGAIFNDQNGTVTLSNVTFADNKAVNLEGRGENGGAIANLGTITIRRTLLAASAGGNCYLERFVTDAGYNLSDDGTCGFTSTSRNDVANIDLATGLAQNGGPTETIALTSTSSAAVDQIPPGLCPATDQRGFLRPAPGQTNCDIGAFELGAQPPPPTVGACGEALACDQ
jgi:CSLREA domain-containing protein